MLKVKCIILSRKPNCFLLWKRSSLKDRPGMCTYLHPYLFTFPLIISFFKCYTQFQHDGQLGWASNTILEIPDRLMKHTSCEKSMRQQKAPDFSWEERPLLAQSGCRGEAWEGEQLLQRCYFLQMAPDVHSPPAAAEWYAQGGWAGEQLNTGPTAKPCVYLPLPGHPQSQSEGMATVRGSSQRHKHGSPGSHQQSRWLMLQEKKEKNSDKWMNLSQGHNCYREKQQNQTIYISQKSS